MMLLTVLFSFFLVCQHVTVSICQENNPCAWKFSDGFIDLSSVGLLGRSRFFVLSDGKFYSYNPCYPVSYRAQDFAVDKQPCINVAACVIGPGSGNGSLPTQRALGLQNTAVFSRDENITKISYFIPGVSAVSLTVTLNCNDTIEHDLKVQSESSFVLTAQCACLNNEKCKSASPSHSKSGLSTGSILLITFFVILLVYVGVGILFNFCRGAHGAELLPNVEFWNELPKLIVDGFLFTCSCFGRRSSYADV